MFLKNRNISSKIKRSKVTDYAALRTVVLFLFTDLFNFKRVSQLYLYLCKALTTPKMLILATNEDHKSLENRVFDCHFENTVSINF